MGLTSEQVHWIAGGAVAVIALLMLLHESGAITRRWPLYLLPAGLLVWGVEAIVDPFIHGSALPGGYAAEAGQHAVMGTAMLVMGGVELARVRGSTRRAAGWVLPAGLALMAGMFLFHAQHDSAAPALVLITQHRALGLTLALTAVARGVSELRHPKSDSFRVASLVLLLLVGLLLLAYTEGTPSGAGQVPSSHGGH